LTTLDEIGKQLCKFKVIPRCVLLFWKFKWPLIHLTAETSAYIALSYVWGHGPEDKAIVVNGCRASLDSALRHIRRHRETRAVQPLWIDAICINQKNNAEKSAQVALMKGIYATAYRVIVWLGEELLGTTKLAVGRL
jgi:hypothetical protein